MNRKKFVHQRLTLCKKFENAKPGEQYTKIFEEVQELAQAYSNFVYAKENCNLDRASVRALADEAIDVSKAVQLFVHILVKNEVRQMCISVEDLYTDNDRKNEQRGYHKAVNNDI